MKVLFFIVSLSVLFKLFSQNTSLRFLKEDDEIEKLADTRIVLLLELLRLKLI